MHSEHNDKQNAKSIDNTELEAVTNATFDSWTQGARDFYKGTRKLIEALDDHSCLIMTDIFGPEIAKEHSHKLEEQAEREAEAGHMLAANHYKRRDLNFSRSTLGEFDQYTVALSERLKSNVEANPFAQFDQAMTTHNVSTLTAVVKPHHHS